MINKSARHYFRAPLPAALNEASI